MSAAIQFWKIEGEWELMEEFPQPEDKYTPNRQWWCSRCGEIWAWLAYFNLERVKEQWQGMWRMESRFCPRCGSGKILDIAVVMHIEPLPIPTAIYLREIKRELLNHERSSKSISNPSTLDHAPR